MARYRRRKRRRRSSGMKKAHKDMLKGGAIASAILVFQTDWYKYLVGMIRGARA